MLFNKSLSEIWLKPPKVINYTNSIIESIDGEKLICKFFLPEKYAKNPFFINSQKILSAGDMFYGIRYFYSDRFYSLREYYSEAGKLTAYYIDITLPAVIKESEVIILDMKIDFWVYPDKKKYLILDINEWQDALQENLFSEKEIKVCDDMFAFIKNKLDNDKFDEIFTDYKRSSPEIWDRYNKFLNNIEIIDF